jgi:hypothetical protein
MAGKQQIDLLPYGVALLSLGAGMLYVTFSTLGADDVSYARTQATAWVSMALASPAIVLFALGRPGYGDWRRAFWTAGFAAYCFHLWWAVFRTYRGDFSAIIDRQGWVAFTNFAVIFVWGLDVARDWTRTESSGAKVWQWVAWLLVTLSFLGATALFRSGTASLVGYILGAVIVWAFVARYRHSRRTGDPSPAARPV